MRDGVQFGNPKLLNLILFPWKQENPLPSVQPLPPRNEYRMNRYRIYDVVKVTSIIEGTYLHYILDYIWKVYEDVWKNAATRTIKRSIFCIWEFYF